MQKTFRLTALSCAFLTAAGCSSQQVQSLKDSANTLGKDYGMAVLCGVGIVGGAAAGFAINGEKGALAGGAVGAALGCALGYVWQSRLKELDRIAKEENLKITTEQLTVASSAVVTSVPKEAGLVTQIEDTGMFASGSDQLTTDGQRAVTKLANMYSKAKSSNQQSAAKELQERRLLVVGHSDATGSSEFNQKLSERRAKTVGRLLMQAGIPASLYLLPGCGDLHARLQITATLSREARTAG